MSKVFAALALKKLIAVSLSKHWRCEEKVRRLLSTMCRAISNDSGSNSTQKERLTSQGPLKCPLTIPLD